MAFRDLHEGILTEFVEAQAAHMEHLRGVFAGIEQRILAELAERLTDLRARHRRRGRGRSRLPPSVLAERKRQARRDKWRLVEAPRNRVRRMMLRIAIALLTRRLLVATSWRNEDSLIDVEVAA